MLLKMVPKTSSISLQAPQITIAVDQHQMLGSFGVIHIALGIYKSSWFSLRLFHFIDVSSIFSQSLVVPPDDIEELFLPI